MNDFVRNPRAEGLAPIDLREWFGNDRPVVMEIGSGSGRFLVTSAMERPEVNFLGVEKSLHFHRVIEDRVKRRQITNIRLVNYDAFLVLEKMIADKALAEIHIYFPDPWPRPREQKRRIIRPAALHEMRRTLADDGLGVFVTDHAKYFESAVPLIRDVFEIEPRTPTADDPPRTNYEAKYREEGRPIYEVRFRKR